VLGAAIALAAAAPQFLPPVERCGGDPEFSRVRSRLNRAVAHRDLDGLVALMSNDVRISFGSGVGKEAFVRQWSSSPSDRARLWLELDKVLRLGCAKAVDGSGREYRAMPAMFVTGDGLDGFSTWVALPSAVIRRRPKASASVRTRLAAWSVLENVDHDGGDWIEVRSNGLPGYISTKQARSLLDYRIVFGHREGQWRITAFVAGD